MNFFKTLINSMKHWVSLEIKTLEVKMDKELEQKQPKGDYVLSKDLSSESLVTKPEVFDYSTIANFTNVLEEAGLVGGVRLQLGTMTEEATTLPLATTGYIPIAHDSIIRVNEDFPILNGGNAGIIVYDSLKNPLKSNSADSIGLNTYFNELLDTDANGYIRSFKIVRPDNVAYIRICNDTNLIGRYPVVTVDEEITYSEGYGEKLSHKVKVDFSQITNVPDNFIPVKGTDYWTADDKSAIVSDVLDELPTWNGGSY